MYWRQKITLLFMVLTYRMHNIREPHAVKARIAACNPNPVNTEL